MSVLNQRVERDFKSVVQAQMVLADTLNQQVTGSTPVRLTASSKSFANIIYLSMHLIRLLSNAPLLGGQPPTQFNTQDL